MKTKHFNRLFLSITFLLTGIAAASESSLSIQNQIEEKWDRFQAGREFALFKPHKPDGEISAEYAALSALRRQIWDAPEYELSAHLLSSDLVRAPHCVAFDFNNTVPYYNASTIYLDGKTYIACEGPRSKDVPAFFRLLSSQGVTHLVRLTSPFEGWTKKCHPYWDGIVSESEGKAFLNIPSADGIHQVEAFHMDRWIDNQGVDPEELLNLVLQVRKELNDQTLLLVHCSAGVGRTGTFLAALAIVDAIDRNEPFSIEEIVFRLSLQRVHSVSKISQYFTLYKLADAYLYTNEFKNWEFGKEAAQIFASGANDHCRMARRE